MLHYIALTVDIWNTRPIEDEQAEQTEWLKKAIERFYGENAIPDMERWIKNEQKGQDNERVC